MPGTVPWQQSGLGDACQSGKMATLLNSLFFVFNISFLSNYHVGYYDYIVTWYAQLYIMQLVCIAGHFLIFSFNKIIMYVTEFMKNLSNHPCPSDTEEPIQIVLPTAMAVQLNLVEASDPSTEACDPSTVACDPSTEACDPLTETYQEKTASATVDADGMYVQYVYMYVCMCVCLFL